MKIRRQIIPVRLLIRRSVRYLLVKRGFRLVEAAVVVAALAFVLTGSRIAAIDRLGNRADIVASVVVTALAIALLTAFNRRVMVAIDRRFFREAYDAQVILTELGEAIRSYTKIEQLLELVAAKITDALHPENVIIFLADEATGDLFPAFTSDNSTAINGGSDARSTLVLSRDGEVFKRLKELPTLSAIEFQIEGHLADPRERRTLAETRPALLIPIGSNGHLYGVISLGRRLGDLPYSKDDEQLLRTVASQMSIIIENAKLISRMAEEERIRRELEMAAEVQRHLFPASALDDAAVELYGTCLPARWVGGDYYDYFEMRDRRVGIAIADVAGKGIAAALLMSTVQALLLCQLTSKERSLTEVVSSINQLLRRSTSQGGYVTFFLAEFDKETRGLTYVNAGHNPPMLIRRSASQGGGEAHLGREMALLDGKPIGLGVARTVTGEDPITRLTAGGPIIGTFLDGPYEQETIQLESGDLFVAFTDGVTEALNPGGIEFGEERLRSVAIQSSHLTAREVAEKILASVLEWQGGAPQHDDITLIVAKVK